MNWEDILMQDFGDVKVVYSYPRSRVRNQDAAMDDYVDYEEVDRLERARDARELNRRYHNG